MSDVKEEINQNLVDLQDILSKQAVKIEDLARQVAKLVRIFEDSAKSFEEKSPESSNDDEIKSKLNTLLDQNKILAKGITMLEEKIRNQPNAGQYQQQYPPMQMQRSAQLPQFQPRMTPSLSPPKPSDINSITPKPKPLPTENG